MESLRKQNLSWKEVAGRFRERFNKDSTEARLQMRMLRRRKSSAPWHEADVSSMFAASFFFPLSPLPVNHLFERVAKYGVDSIAFKSI